MVRFNYYIMLKKILITGFIAGIYLFSFSVANASAPESFIATTTGYYSPLKGQNTYYHGNYHDEILVNGFGVSTASGVAPYDGVIAAPQGIPFGTIMYIEGVGYSIVEDRGGAIRKDEENELFRVDVWFGKGENSLKKALNWGRRDVEIVIFSQEFAHLPSYDFNTTLKKEDTGEKVKEVQEYLKSLGFFDHAVTGYYGEITWNAVLEFQLWKKIIPNANIYGAGIVGPATRRTLNNYSSLLQGFKNKKKKALEESPPYAHSQNLINELYLTTLREGDSSYYVFMLQSRLEKLGYFHHKYKTYDFRSKTKEALISFQKAHNISGEYGVFAVKTRNALRQKLLK